MVAAGLAYAALYQTVTEVTAIGVTTGATFWPAAGLTLAVLLSRPRREWPWFLAVFAGVEATLDIVAGFGVAVSLGWGLANTAEPAVAALLLARMGRSMPDLSRRSDLARLAIAGVVVGPLVGALVGTAAAAVLAGDPWWPRLPRWYVGDAIGVVVVAPALLVWWQRRTYRPSGAGILPLALLGLASVVALGPWEFAGNVGLPFLVLPILALVAVRLGTWGVALGTLVVAVVVETVTATGLGPFAEQGAFHGLIVAQMFLAMGAFTSLMIAALMSDLVQREELESTLRSQALHDSLTGLANRRLLFDRIELASRRLYRRPGTLALLFVDLDGFKQVNDGLGHAAGDAVLVETARRLERAARSSDTVARLGGDEFLVLAEDAGDDAGVEALAGRVAESLAEAYEWEGHRILLSASLGIATRDQPGVDAEALLVAADESMYQRKRSRTERGIRVLH